MSVYVIAQVTFTDETRYRAYQAAFADVFRTSGGRVLAADEAPRLLEGDWLGDKVVIMEFPDEHVATSFLQSPTYQDISKDRHAGATTVGLMVQGLS